MNITLNIPAASFERLLSALERIALATEKIAPPDISITMPEPFAPELWGTSSNAQSIQIEEEDRWAAKGYGPDYEKDLLSAANRIRDIARSNREGEPEDASQS